MITDYTEIFGVISDVIIAVFPIVLFVGLIKVVWSMVSGAVFHGELRFW